jgi:F-type H+-transporting ATPase subunit b
MQGLLREALQQITAAPGHFAAEVIQSALLVGGIVWFGRKLLGKRLVARRAQIAADAAAAAAAEERWARIQDEVGAVVAAAERDGAAILEAARRQADEERSASTARIEQEAEETIAEARQTIDRERHTAMRETADRLVRLTTETVTRYLDEMLTEGERRDLLQKAILATLQELGQEAPADRSGAT